MVQGSNTPRFGLNIHRLYARAGRKSRERRMSLARDLLRLTYGTRVLDVGGTPDNWLLLPEEDRPFVTLLNTRSAPEQIPERMAWRQASALDLPFNHGDFDVVFSNSTIEHVQTWEKQQRFAEQILRLQCPYLVQTPNFWFPIEPHFLGFGVQWWPRPVARFVAKYLSIWGFIERRYHATVDLMLDEIRLLTAAQLHVLFPNARIIRERALGLTKSLIAVHQ